MKGLSLLLIATLLLLVSCTSARRYRSASYAGEDSRLAAVSLFSSRVELPRDQPARDDLWSLSANAQTRLLQVLDTRYPSNEAFMKALNASYGNEELSLYDRSQMDLVLVFSVQRMGDYGSLGEPDAHFSPADRMERIELSLELPEGSGMEYLTWDHFETRHAELELAEVSFSRSLNLDAGVEPGPIELDAGAQISRGEKQKLMDRYISVNGRLSPTSLYLEQEGNRGVDPDGNVLVRIRVGFKSFPDLLFRARFVSDTNGGSRLGGLVMQPVLLPALEDLPDTLWAELGMDYIYRHVRAGEKSWSEHDDRVEFYQGKSKQKVPLLLRRDLDPGFFGLADERGDMLRVYLSGREAYLLQFPSWHEATAFLSSLSAEGLYELPGMPEGAFLRLGGVKLAPEHLDLLKVRSIYGGD